MLWVCVGQPASGMFRGGMGRMASSSSSLGKRFSLSQKAVQVRPCVAAETWVAYDRRRSNAALNMRPQRAS